MAEGSTWAPSGNSGESRQVRVCSSAVGERERPATPAPCKEVGDVLLLDPGDAAAGLGPTSATLTGGGLGGG